MFVKRSASFLTTWSSTPKFSALILILLTAVPALATGTVIRFDLPPTVAAKPARPNGDASHDRLVECPIRISSLIVAPDSPQIDQWLVICQPRDGELTIVDYRPKTVTESNMEGPIEVKVTDETSATTGLSLDGGYGRMVSGHVGADAGKKTTDARQYALAAQKQTVTASGTINRGRGVYFKLRRTRRQILEGDKTFTLIFRVPDQWRGSLIDVSVTAQSLRPTLGGLDQRIETMGQSKFVVAAYRAGDTEAATMSRQLADAEQTLRELAEKTTSKNPSNSLPDILRRVAVKLDLDSPEVDDRWIWRLLAGDADPHLDKEIQRLPMEFRIAALDYCDVRDQFTQLAHARQQDNSRRRVAVHK